MKKFTFVSTFRYDIALCTDRTGKFAIFVRIECFSWVTGISATTKKLIRIGSRSKSEALNNFNLRVARQRFTKSNRTFASASINMRYQQRDLGLQIGTIQKTIRSMNQRYCLFDVRHIIQQLYGINFPTNDYLENWLLDQTNYIEQQILRREEQNFLQNFMDVGDVAQNNEGNGQDNGDLLGFEDLERDAEYEALDDANDDNRIFDEDDEQLFDEDDLRNFLESSSSKLRKFCHIRDKEDGINLLYGKRQQLEALINFEYSYELHHQMVAIDRNIHKLEQELHYLRVSLANEKLFL